MFIRHLLYIKAGVGTVVGGGDGIAQTYFLFFREAETLLGDWRGLYRK